MNNKEINQAIFMAMCELATKYLNIVAEKSETLQKKLQDKPTLTIKDLQEVSTYKTTDDNGRECWGNIELWQKALDDVSDDVTFYEEAIAVEGFKCTMYAHSIFYLMKKFDSAKASKFTFTYEKKEDRELIASFDMGFDQSAKRMADFTANKKQDAHTYDFLPVFRNVYVEYDKVTQAVNFVATDTHALTVITDNDDSIKKGSGDYAVALVPSEGWKAVIEAMRKTKQDMNLTFYARKEGEHFDTLVIKVADTIVKSIQLSRVARYPDWRRVLPDKSKLHYFAIHQEDIKNAQKWLSKVKKPQEGTYLSVSVYEGSDRIYFDLCDPVYYAQKETEYRRSTVSFRLDKPSNMTLGVPFDPVMAKKFVPVGFYIDSEKNRAAMVEDIAFDVLLAMPRCEVPATFDLEKREVHALAECA